MNLENSKDGNFNEQKQEQEEFRDEAKTGGDIEEFEDEEEEEEGNRQEEQVRRERQEVEAGAEAEREATRAEEGTEENIRSGTRREFVSAGDVADDEDGDQDSE
jgi:hypothetical protein